MATHSADYDIVILRDATTGALDTTTRTVELQPTDQAYPTGAVACTQLSSLYAYKPDSDLNDEKHYWVYVDGTKKHKHIAWNSEPSIGG